jgi:hypothetical protein
MSFPGLRLWLAVIICAIVASTATLWLARSSTVRPGATLPSSDTIAKGNDPKPARPTDVVIDPRQFEDSGFQTANAFTGAINDLTSLTNLRQALQARGPEGLAQLTARYKALAPPGDDLAQRAERSMLEKSLGLITMFQGRFDDSAQWMERALGSLKTAGAPPQERAELMAILGIVALRRGEVDNCIACVGPSSCIFPISSQAVHQNPSGSREAVRWFTEYLRERPRDLRVIWLLNIA